MRSRSFIPPVVAPALTGVALAAAGVVVALNDPSAEGSRFPACGFRAATGLWCPGCGLTRATHELFTGDPLAALGYNVFVPFFLVAIVAGWLTWTLSTVGRKPPWHRLRIPPQAIFGLGALLLVFGALRNLPTSPFSALAP